MVQNAAASTSTAVGIVHPGQMGAAVGRCLRDRGHRVVWASDGRGPGTAARAAAAGIEDVGSLAALLEASDVVVSIVPPHAAAEVASAIDGRARLLIDANAISPAESMRIRAAVEATGGAFVDGGIIGTPPSPGSPARLFLSGPGAGGAAAVLGGDELQAIALEGPAAASALKMCYAAWTKGSQALLLASLAASRAHGVEPALVEEWERSQPTLPTMATRAGSAAARKGWRWTYEMRAISETFREAGLPDGFHEAAARIFERAPRDEDADPGHATLDQVLQALLDIGTDVGRTQAP